MVLVKHLFHVLLVLSIVLEVKAEDPLVETTHGKVRGMKMSVLDKTINVFYGIPYGKPPVASLRFKRPEPAAKWGNKTLDATTPHSACPQNNYLHNYWVTDKKKKSEDCLCLNIWVPTNVTEKLTTLVWIFGGGFTMGSINDPLYQGHYFAAVKNVIIASMNYRMGALGFFYTGSDAAPGNQGLLDQMLAMRWIQNNIHSFGGDPKKITLFGESAGSVSVNLHLFSPLSRTLFEYAIMESGLSTAKWSMGSKKYMKSMSWTLAKNLGCSANESKMIKCMQNVDVQKIVYAKVTVPESKWYYLTWTPIVDGYFIPDHPNRLLKEGKVKKTKIILGVNKDDGSVFTLYLFPNNLFEKGIVEACNMTVCMFGAQWNSPNQAAVAEIAAQTYELTMSHSLFKYPIATSNVISDSAFKCPAASFAKSYAELGNDVFLYSLHHRSKQCIVPKFMGVGHTCELQMVFGHTLNESISFTEVDKDLSRKFMTYWTTFAKTG